MATAPSIAFRAVKTLSGMSIPRHEFPEGASVTFKAGAPLTVTSGYLAECGADPAEILGIATRDGQNGGSAGLYKQVVVLAHPDTVFLGNLDTSAAEDAGTTAATDRMTAYGIAKKSSGGLWYVDKTETSNKRVRVWDFWGEDAVGDVKGRVLFSFISAYFEGQIV